MLSEPICAVKDKKTGLFDRIFTVRHAGEAIREFETICKDTNTKFGKNPEDFDLYQIGTMDYQSGVTGLETPVQLRTGIS